MNTTPAFKEWQVIVGALAAGEQILLLRKGGIAEGRGGFQVRAQHFWLYPTAFHEQREKTKPAAHRYFTDPPPSAHPEIRLTCRAEVVATAFLDDWSVVARLDPFHLWTEATVRERFDWVKPPGLHALVVRIHRIREPITFVPTPAMAGCKSWVEVPFRFEDHPAAPVLDDESFTQVRARIGHACDDS